MHRTALIYLTNWNKTKCKQDPTPLIHYQRPYSGVNLGTSGRPCFVDCVKKTPNTLINNQ